MALLQKSKAHALLVAFDAALLVAGVVLCICGVEEGALLAVIGSFFLPLATWSSWPLPARRAAQAIVALAWLCFAVWFCLSYRTTEDVPAFMIGGDCLHGWPFCYGVTANDLVEDSVWGSARFSAPALAGDALVGAAIGLAPVVIAWLMFRRRAGRCDARPTAASPKSDG
ncbi:MAG: hypothetical protein ACYS9X_25275 [Planctomycetota bacterium]